MIQVKLYKNGRIEQWALTNVKMDGWIQTDFTDYEMPFNEYVLKDGKFEHSPAPSEKHSLNSDGEWVVGKYAPIPILKMEY